MPKAQGRGRMRIREQLIQLRSVVKQMETHLETLKSPTSPRVRVCADSDLTAVANASHVDDGSVWKDIAMEQFRARRKAELHNVQLRENLSASILLSERVKKLLQSQNPHPVSADELQFV
ncbi:hypothetical protein PHMEG_0009534 [Phytophthora megakarya]|uniref:Uncharacterized protein n=1 Tax=Phytophthora megakarya TaxID=4795 RepID=A0A225WI19_9STRA|nr:hypothetical protein PHMEG_0009534 [Phytophthora megakarya]